MSFCLQAREEGKSGHRDAVEERERKITLCTITCIHLLSLHLFYFYCKSFYGLSLVPPSLTSTIEVRQGNGTVFKATV